MQRKSRLHYSLRAKVSLGAIIITLVCAGVALGLYRIQATGTKYTGPLESVSTGFIGEYAALILVAQDQGYFEDNGLRVTTTAYSSGPAALQDVFNGKLDTAMAADFAGVRETLNGKDLKILATMSKSKAFFMVANKARGINTVSDIKGKRIGITRKTVGEFYLGRFLVTHNITLKDVTIVDMPQSELLKAQKEGQLDAAVLFEPNAYKARAQLGNQAIQWSVQGEDDLYSLLYTTSKMTRERPEVLDRYMRAVVSAERFVKSHNDRARAIIAKRLHYEQAYINYIWPRFTFQASLEQELLIGLDDKARWAIENQLTPATQPVNYLRAIYFEGLERAKPEGVSVIR